MVMLVEEEVVMLLAMAQRLTQMRCTEALHHCLRIRREYGERIGCHHHLPAVGSERQVSR
jgi:hypothetical protein